MKPTGAQLREMRRENLRWPEQLAVVPREQWPLLNETNSGARPRIAFWRSRKFLVQGFDEGAGCVRLSVNRTEWDERQKRFRDDIDWDDLQRLKGEAGYGAHCALEVLPPDGFVVNVANMRHIFILPLGQAPSFMWGYERFRGCGHFARGNDGLDAIPSISRQISPEVPTRTCSTDYSKGIGS